MAAAWDIPAAPLAPPVVLAEQRSAAKPAPIQIPQTQQSATATNNSSPDSPLRPPVSPITPVASFAVLAREGSVKPPPHPPQAMATTFPKSPPKVASEPRISNPPAPAHLSKPKDSVPPKQQISSTSSDRSINEQTPRSFGHDANAHTQSAQVHAQFKQSPDSAPQFNYTTHPVPISLPESDNTDAQALRAALAVLQIQRDKSTRDIKTLTTLKEAAANDPQRFVDEMLSGKLGHQRAPGAVPDPLRPTLEDDYSDDDNDNDDDDNHEDDNYGDKVEKDGENLKERDGEENGHNEDKTQNKKLPKFPTRQNIVRCPPVNWAKYHVLGDSLDKLHEEQRRRPTPGEPGIGGVVGGEWTGRDHVVAAPYSPWVDALQHPMQTRRGSKKPLG